VYAGRRSQPRPNDIWDIAGTARTYTTIVGTLAGFSVTSSIFIANLSVARRSTNFEGVIALFLIAFLVFISSAMQFGTTPNLTGPGSEGYRTVQEYSYLLANASFYLGLCLSWLGLPLLLAAIGLDYLADVFAWMVLFAILGGAMRVSSSGLNIFTRIQLLSGLSLPFICFGAAAIY
jgi:protein-S-isoprenylcysteine O-methyltransferase Ste14